MIEKIFILHHTHIDVGFTGPRLDVGNALINMIDQVTDLAKASANRPGPEQFHWIHEVSWPVLEYLKRPSARKDDLFEQIRKGLVELTAMYLNPTELLDRDTWELSIDYACKLAKENNLPLKTAMFSDCPAVAWSVPDILAKRGIKYLSTSPNLIMSYELEIERPFYWEGPEGGRVLTWYSDGRNYGYAEGKHILKLHEDPVAATKMLMAYVKQIQGEGYRWKGLAIHVALDNEPPAPSLMDFVAYFNRQNPAIQVCMATNNDFFEYMEEHHRSQFQVHKAAWPDWWGNGIATAAYECACSRQTKIMLKRIKALAPMINCPINSKQMDEIVETMLMFDEHTFGFNACVSAPWSLVSRMEWAEKRILAHRALYKAQLLEKDVSKNIADKDKVVIANPFDNDWTGIIKLDNPEKFSGRASLKDTETSQEIAGQKYKPVIDHGPDGNYFSLTIPSRTIRKFERKKALAKSSTLGQGMENDFYKIDFDARTGAIKSIFDKTTRRELIDPAAAWSFAEIIHDKLARGDRLEMYNPFWERKWPDMNLAEARRPRPEFIYRAGHTSDRSIKISAGEVFNSMVTKGSLPTARFVREIRLFHAIKRIDILLELNKDVEINYESFYMAFPFMAQKPNVWIELAGSLFRAGIDQLPGSSTDWQGHGSYVAVTDNAESTAILVPHDTALVQVDDINTGKWAKRLDVQKGHVYSWLMNNLWYTNFPAYQEGIVNLRWSITNHNGAFNKTSAEQFAFDTELNVSVI